MFFFACWGGGGGVMTRWWHALSIPLLMSMPSSSKLVLLTGGNSSSSSEFLGDGKSISGLLYSTPFIYVSMARFQTIRHRGLCLWILKMCRLSVQISLGVSPISQVIRSSHSKDSSILLSSVLPFEHRYIHFLRSFELGSQANIHLWKNSSLSKIVSGYAGTLGSWSTAGCSGSVSRAFPGFGVTSSGISSSSLVW